MDALRERLILQEVKKRLKDAEILEDHGDLDYGDSDYLLRLLALELLLKFHYEVSTGKTPPKDHKYHKLFANFSSEHKKRLIEKTGNRIGPSELSTRPMEVLREWSSNFVLLRYPYDRYQGMSEKEYKRRADEWIKEGAKMEEADFRHHPEELDGLLYALQCVKPPSSNNKL